MLRIYVSAIWILLCFKLGDWKNWKLYYSTMLFYIVSNFACDIITQNKPLWLFTGSFWNHTFANFFNTVIVYPFVIILFLSNIPKKLFDKFCYIVLWVFVLSAQEYIVNQLGWILFFNGWNIGCSILFYFIVFPLLILHFKMPLLAWLVFFVLTISVIFIFNIPLNSLR